MEDHPAVKWDQDLNLDSEVNLSNPEPKEHPDPSMESRWDPTDITRPPPLSRDNLDQTMARKWDPDIIRPPSLRNLLKLVNHLDLEE